MLTQQLYNNSKNIPSATSNVGFRHWLRVSMQQRACDCHQVITHWCQEELNRTGLDEATWILNDIPQKEYCGPEILGDGSMIGTCFKSSCLVQITPCADLVPDCIALQSLAASNPIEVKRSCYEGLTASCPVVCQSVELGSCDLISIFWYNEPHLATESCNKGLFKFCPVTCGAPRCILANTTVPIG